MKGWIRWTRTGAVFLISVGGIVVRLLCVTPTTSRKDQARTTQTSTRRPDFRWHRAGWPTPPMLYPLKCLPAKGKS